MIELIPGQTYKVTTKKSSFNITYKPLANSVDLNWFVDEDGLNFYFSNEELVNMRFNDGRKFKLEKVD